MEFRKDVQEAIWTQLLGLMPERESELKDLWEKYQPKFNLVEDVTRDGKVILDAGLYREVRFNHRSMKLIWLASFVAWEGYCAVDAGWDTQQFELVRFKSLVAVFKKIMDADDPDTVPWPDSLPRPGTLPDATNDVQLRAAAELAIFASGWALLHEIRHIKHQQDGTSSGPYGSKQELHDEEFSCDAFAAEFILEQVEQFAGSEGVDASRVRQKREMGLLHAMFALSMLTIERWGDSVSHPDTLSRIHRGLNIIGTTVEKDSLKCSCMSFIALSAIYPNSPQPFTVDE